MAWTRSLLRAKARVLAVHVGISAVGLCPLLYLAWFHWYPAPLFFSDGGWQGLRVVLGIYIVLGPLLMFLVYHPAKTRLALGIDVGFIAIAQIAALGFGGWTIEDGRPMAMAFHEGRFNAVPRDAFAAQTPKPSDWRRLGEGPPYWVYVRRPATNEERVGVAAFLTLEGQSAEQLLFLYEPLAGHWPDVAREALTSNVLAKESPRSREAVAALLSGRGLDPAQARVFRHAGRYRDALLVFDRSGRYLGGVVGDPVSAGS